MLKRWRGAKKQRSAERCIKMQRCVVQRYRYGSVEVLLQKVQQVQRCRGAEVVQSAAEVQKYT